MKALFLIPLTLLLTACAQQQPTVDRDVARAMIPLIIAEIEYQRGSSAEPTPEQMARLRRYCALAGLGSVIVEGGAVPEDVYAACEIANAMGE